MTKKLILLLLVPGLLLGVLLKTQGQQSFEGTATYRSSMRIDNINVQGSNMSPEQEESIRKQLMQSSQRDYTLKFNIQESLWKEEARLDPVSNASANNGMQIRISTGNAIAYMNPGKNEFLEETEIFGKKFLIQDELETFEWKITDETKKIGDYTVIKAEYQNISERTSISLTDSESKTVKVTDTTQVVAWYTPEIPVSQGPNNTWGLPGLILELDNGNMSYLCTKISLNPEEPVVIEKPRKGKRVTREEADKIRDEKMQEMMKKYDMGEGGERRVISIRG